MSSEISTRARILDAAVACAQARPDFSMAQVAAGAGVSRQAVYLHFPDRAALLAAVQAGLDVPDSVELIAQAPSARAALAALLAALAETYPQVWPVLRASGTSEADDRLALCQALAARFRSEGALAPHLSPATAADLLFSLTSAAVWHDLTGIRGWDTSRYRAHIGYLAVSAITR